MLLVAMPKAVLTNSLDFILNGENFKVPSDESNVSLNEFIRTKTRFKVTHIRRVCQNASEMPSLVAYDNSAPKR